MLVGTGPLLAAALLTTAFAAAPAGAAPAGRWSEQRAWQWYRAQPWIVGCNYVPSTAANTTEFWAAGAFDEATIDRELGWARGLGFNACRVFLQYAVWKADPAGMRTRFRRYLAIADHHGIRVAPVLFDDCTFGDPVQTEPFLGTQRPPIPGMILPSWTPSPGFREVTDRAAWPDLERYVRDMVGAFRKDRRVLLWDLYNEPGNSGMGEKSLPLAEAAFGWARAAAPEQPLTVGLWTGERPALSARMRDLSDVVTFHAYTNTEGLRRAIADHANSGRPTICTEFLARLMGGRWEADLPVFREAGVGCMCWGLVNGRTQAQFSWANKRGDPEPAVWFHDLLRADGSPYSADEVAFIRQAASAPGVPALRPMLDYPMRDTCVCRGPDGWFYLTGTTGHPTWWRTNDGIGVWRSHDRKRWQPIGLVWSFARDATWQKPAEDGRRAIWAPELHYFRGTYWIAYCVNYGGTGILRSTSGKAEGPYVDVKPDGPLTGEIDASLFQDDGGAVYFVFQNGKIARMRDDMTGLAEEPRLIRPEGSPQVGFEGAFLFRANGRYYLSCADFVGDEYHCYVASAPALNGPWGPRRLAIPHGGHNMFFDDGKGGWWSTFFGNDRHAPFTERPAILPVEFGMDGGVRPLIRKDRQRPGDQRR